MCWLINPTLCFQWVSRHAELLLLLIVPFISALPVTKKIHSPLRHFDLWNINMIIILCCKCPTEKDLIVAYNFQQEWTPLLPAVILMTKTTTWFTIKFSSPQELHMTIAVCVFCHEHKAEIILRYTEFRKWAAQSTKALFWKLCWLLRNSALIANA